MAVNLKKSIGSFSQDIKDLGGAASIWVADPLDQAKVKQLVNSALGIAGTMTGVNQVSQELRRLADQAAGVKEATTDSGIKLNPVVSEAGALQDQGFTEQGISDFLAQQAAARQANLTSTQGTSSEALRNAIQALQTQSAGATGQLSDLQQALAARAGNIDAQGLQLQLAAENPQLLAQQQQLSDLLLARAQGQGGPSPAELMLTAQNEKALRNQMALAASMSGRSLPAAQRQILQQQAIGGQELAQQAAILRAQEQQQAQGQSAAILEAMRAAGLQQAGLGLQQQTAQGQQNLARQQAIEEALRAREVTQADLAKASVAGQLGTASQIFGAQAGDIATTRAEAIAAMEANQAAAAAERQRQADLAESLAQRQSQERMAAMQAQAQLDAAKAQQKAQILGSVIGAAGAAGAAAAGG